MSNRYDQYLQNPNIRRTLDAIRYAEGTDKGEAGYRTMFGGDTFDTSGGWRHPDRVVNRPGYSSAAAGAYQFLPGTWNEASKAVGATDFSPANQDRAALFLIERRGVSLDKLAKSGFDDDDLERLAPEWASLPTKKGSLSTVSRSKVTRSCRLAFRKATIQQVSPRHRHHRRLVVLHRAVLPPRRRQPILQALTAPQSLRRRHLAPPSLTPTPPRAMRLTR